MIFAELTGAATSYLFLQKVGRASAIGWEYLKPGDEKGQNRYNTPMIVFLDSDVRDQLPVIVSFNFLWDSINALHPLYKPENHADLLEWVSAMSSLLDPTLLEENRCLHEEVHIWFDTLALEALTAGLDRNWQKTLAALRSIPPLELIWRRLGNFRQMQELAEASSDPVKFEQLVPPQVEDFPLQYLGLRKAIGEAESYMQKVISFLEQILPPLEPFYQKQISRLEEFRRQLDSNLKTSTLRSVLQKITPRLALRDDGVLELSPQRFQFDLRQCQRLIIAPTSFFGHRYATRYGEDMVICTTLRFQTSGPVPRPDSDMIKKVRVLSDETNLMILKYLARRPLCTTELTELLGTSQPLITKHLNELRSCGLVQEGFKVKNRVFLMVNFLEAQAALNQIFNFIAD